MTLRVAGITEDSIVDGPGLRLVVFTQGCPHGCAGCHNPETWPFSAGTEMTVAEIVDRLKANPLLDGLTLSGGEPFAQATPCSELAREAHKLGLNVWCYTGFEWEYLTAKYAPASFGKLLQEVDVVVDGEFIAGQRTLELPWRGSRNQRLIDVRKSLEHGSVVEVQGSR